MPGRRGVLLTDAHVRGARLTKSINVGETNNVRAMAELSSLKKRKFDAEFASGKIYIKRGALGAGKEKAQRAFFKPIFGSDVVMQGLEGARIVGVMDKLRARGLPVPKAGVVEYNGQKYLAMEAYVRKGGATSKIIPINTRPGSHIPYFLSRLNAQRDAKLISQLGHDTAEVVNAGMYTKYFDFFGFYQRKDGSLSRIIMDVENLREVSDVDSMKESINHLFSNIKEVWAPSKKSAELMLSTSALKEGISSPELRSAVDEVVARKSRSLFGYMLDIFAP